MSWPQAAAACRNAGKRLLSNEEWQVAALGTPNPGPAGGDGATACKTDDASIPPAGSPELTGNAPSCVSDVGIFDMLGNVGVDGRGADGRFGVRAQRTLPRRRLPRRRRQRVPHRARARRVRRSVRLLRHRHAVRADATVASAQSAALSLPVAVLVVSFTPALKGMEVNETNDTEHLRRFMDLL